MAVLPVIKRLDARSPADAVRKRVAALSLPRPRLTKCTGNYGLAEGRAGALLRLFVRVPKCAAGGKSGLVVATLLGTSTSAVVKPTE